MMVECWKMLCGVLICHALLYLDVLNKRMVNEVELSCSIL